MSMNQYLFISQLQPEMPRLTHGEYVAAKLECFMVEIIHR